MFENQNQPKKPQTPLPNQPSPSQQNNQKPSSATPQKPQRNISPEAKAGADPSDISAKISELDKMSTGGKKKIIIISLVIVVIIGLIIGAVYLFQSLSSPEEEEIVIDTNNINNNGNLSVNKNINENLSNNNSNTNSNTNTNNYINLNNPDSDSDGDGIINKKESYYGTCITRQDTDGDGYSDLSEIKSKYNPLGSGQLEAEDFYIYCVNNLNDNLEDKYQELIGRNNIDTFCQAGEELISEYGLGKDAIGGTAYLIKCQDKFSEENTNTSNSVLINNCRNELNPLIIDFLSPSN